MGIITGCVLLNDTGVRVCVGEGAWCSRTCTLGDVGRGARRSRTCTLGDVAPMSCGGVEVAVGGRAVGTLGSDGGVVSNVRECSSGVVAMGAGMVHWKSSASLLTARICSVPSVMNGEAGIGLRRASASMRAAVIALSVDDVAGIIMSCGKNSTVRAIRSALVFVMYTVWQR